MVDTGKGKYIVIAVLLVCCIGASLYFYSNRSKKDEVVTEQYAKNDITPEVKEDVKTQEEVQSNEADTADVIAGDTEVLDESRSNLSASKKSAIEKEIDKLLTLTDIK